MEEAKPIFWSLVNSKDGTRIDKLRTRYARGLVATIPRAELGDWLAWTEGAATWHPIVKYPELLHFLGQLTEEKRSVKNSPTPSERAARTAPMNIIMASSDEDVDFSGELGLNNESTSRPQSFEVATFELEEEDSDSTFEMQSESPVRVERRKHTRYNYHIPVIIKANGQEMQTSSLNLSLGGMRIAQPLNSELPEEVNITLVNVEAQLQLICQAQREENGEPTTRLKVISNSDEDVLRTWLLAPGHD